MYYFKSTENRDKFLESPTTYLPDNEPLQPPPPRILVLGVRGSGKTVQGRRLAKEMGVFHVSFRERLQVSSELCSVSLSSVRSVSTFTALSFNSKQSTARRDGLQSKSYKFSVQSDR